ncbi:cupin domain-containing protein [Zoogloea sp. LCSB751]|uniref:cupin domain-containing protein n=1 Tax=Zoogloea sp. LCSB751 TaxID=1965277 RepID=UPI001C1F87AE|nr:cupin domain-containing protein [Zoogloea sp. LCSB751]
MTFSAFKLAGLLTLGIVVIGGGQPGVAQAATVDPRAVEYQLPKDIKWVRNAAGTSEQAVLFGDPNKPGPYVVRIKWLPGNNFSRPHFHNGDRFFAVLSGTWWVGTGDKFDPDATVPVPAGSYVIHHGGQVHYDGAKNEEAIIQVWGIGPVNTTQAAR